MLFKILIWCIKEIVVSTYRFYISWDGAKSVNREISSQVDKLLFELFSGTQKK